MNCCMTAPAGGRLSRLCQMGHVHQHGGHSRLVLSVSSPVLTGQTYQVLVPVPFEHHASGSISMWAAAAIQLAPQSVYKGHQL